MRFVVSQLDDGRACLLVTGPPGAGKSTVAQAVARRLQRAAVLDGDVVNELIVSGRVWALGEPSEEAARQVALCNANLCALASNFAATEITPVIDWIVPDRVQMDFFLQMLAPLPVALVVLEPSAQSCRRRYMDRAPEDQFAFGRHEALASPMRAAFGDVGTWVDSSHLSVEETVEAALIGAAVDLS